MKHVGVRGNAKDVVSQEQLIASSISNTPAGNIAATTVQAAINELDTEKLDKSGGTMTGSLTVAGLLSSSGVIGYTTNAGGTVSQPTSKSTGVTLNKPAGQISMNAASFAAGATVEFALTSSTFTALTGLVVNVSGFVDYAVEVAYPASATSIVLRVTNRGATRSDSIAIVYRSFGGIAS